MYSPNQPGTPGVSSIDSHALSASKSISSICLSQPALKRKWPSPCFEDNELEKAFQLDHNHRFAQRCRHALPVLAVLVLLHIVQFLVSTTAFAWFSRTVSAPLLVFYFGLWICIRADTQAAQYWIESAVNFSLVYVIMMSCFTPDRTAELLTWERDQWSPHAFMESEAIVALTGVLVFAGLMLQTTALRLLVLTQLVFAIYLCIAGVFGSAEYEMMDQLDPVDTTLGQSALGKRMWAHFSLVARCYIIGLVVYTSRVFGECFDRESFAKVYLLEKEVLEQAEMNETLQQAQKEVRERMRAMEGDCSDEDSSSRSDLSSSGSEEQGWFTQVTKVLSNRSSPGMQRTYSETMAERELTVPEPSPIPQVSSSASNADAFPNALLAQAMANKTADWDRIRSMAERITSPDYHLRAFFEDCLASFPELGLFFCGEGGKMGCGQTAAAEYQRTIGALFAVYWLLRLDLDGRLSFCFGVDTQWMPTMLPFLKSDSKDYSSKYTKLQSTMSSSTQKRKEFYEEMPWHVFEALVKQAGCQPGAPGSTERIMAMLCLTAFHDIMKVDALAPKVHKSHSVYGGIEQDCTIHDHDLALAYVLEHFPDLLPSFAGLPSSQQRSVAFTQGKLRFNHGWFVQAEAPPGAMLAGFKEALRAGADAEDVGFYFFHWFTDLAGATATPLGGAEKFVLKFPRSVLSAFLWSIPYLAQLKDHSETEVVETYLQARWDEMFPNDPLTQDFTAVARMRLACMAQDGTHVMSALDRLPSSERLCLVEELSRTGAKGQRYRSSDTQGGPALLIYYSPALLQQHTSHLKDCQQALHTLSCVFLAARTLWPLNHDAQGDTVTVQVGELRDRSMDEVVGKRGYGSKAKAEKVWILKRENEVEGAVSFMSPSDVNDLMSRRERFCFLDFHGAFRKPGLYSKMEPLLAEQEGICGPEDMIAELECLAIDEDKPQYVPSSLQALDFFEF